MTEPRPRSLDDRADSILLNRIDERTQHMSKDLADLRTEVSSEIKGIRDVMVTKVELAPIKAIAFGMVGFILLAVLTALVSQVIIK